jgi:DNA-binding transcriptional regulator YiaG
LYYNTHEVCFYSNPVIQERGIAYWATLEDFRAIENEISDAPERWPVIAGTSGLRKMRFSPERRSGGKSGGVRVCYFLVDAASRVFLVTVLAKNEKENLNQPDRNVIRDFIVRTKIIYRSKGKMMPMTNRNKHTRAGRKIIAGLREIVEALESGEPLETRFTVREVGIPDPGEYNAKAIRALRHQLGLSQRLFAHLMGVSVILEQAWEQGRRFPGATARRLLDEIRRDPKHWATMFQPTKAA